MTSYDITFREDILAKMVWFGSRIINDTTFVPTFRTIFPDGWPSTLTLHTPTILSRERALYRVQAATVEALFPPLSPRRPTAQYGIPTTRGSITPTSTVLMLTVHWRILHAQKATRASITSFLQREKPLLRWCRSLNLQAFLPLTVRLTLRQTSSTRQKRARVVTSRERDMTVVQPALYGLLTTP